MSYRGLTLPPYLLGQKSQYLWTECLINRDSYLHLLFIARVSQ